MAKVDVFGNPKVAAIAKQVLARTVKQLRAEAEAMNKDEKIIDFIKELIKVEDKKEEMEEKYDEMKDGWEKDHPGLEIDYKYARLEKDDVKKYEITVSEYDVTIPSDLLKRLTIAAQMFDIGDKKSGETALKEIVYLAKLNEPIGELIDLTRHKVPVQDVHIARDGNPYNPRTQLEEKPTEDEQEAGTEEE